MKLIGYELRKALGGRFWWLALLFLLVLDAVLFLEPWRAGMLTVGERYREDRPLLDFMYTADKASYASYIDELTERYGDEWEDSFAELVPDGIPGRFLPTAVREVEVLSNCNTFMNILFPQILKDRARIVETARRLGGAALIEGNAYGVRLNLEIIRRYSIKPALLPALASAESKGVFWVYGQNGWKRILNFYWGDLFALLMIILVAARALPSEGKAVTLLHAARYGRRHTAAAKLAMSVLIALFFSILFSAVNLVLADLKYGLGGAGASVLSLLPLSMGPLNMTIGQTIALFTAYKAFGAVCMALIASALSYWLRGSLSSYIGSAVFAGAAYGFYLFAGQNPELSMGLRLLPDVTVWTRPEWMFETYRVTNLFSRPVPWVWICFGFWIFLDTVLCLLAMWRSERGGRLR
jgi:hypothetical protein